MSSDLGEHIVKTVTLKPFHPKTFQPQHILYLSQTQPLHFPFNNQKNNVLNNALPAAPTRCSAHPADVGNLDRPPPLFARPMRAAQSWTASKKQKNCSVRSNKNCLSSVCSFKLSVGFFPNVEASKVKSTPQGIGLALGLGAVNLPAGRLVEHCHSSGKKQCKETAVGWSIRNL